MYANWFGESCLVVRATYSCGGGPSLTFPPNTYVVLEIPPPFSDCVLAIRREQRDFFRWSLPAETTVSGSNGTGPIATDEDSAHVFRVLDQIAAETAPIVTSFGPVRRFEQSDVFFLSFENDVPLRALHQRIATSGLRFSPIPFSFYPHVTLRTRSPVSDDEAATLIAARVPGEFTLEDLSLYELPPREAPRDAFAVLLCLLHRARLTGRG